MYTEENDITVLLRL